MKKTPILILMVLAIATSAAAQTSGGVPPLDVILGYSLQRTQIANQLASIGLDHVNANGAEVGLVYNFAGGSGLKLRARPTIRSSWRNRPAHRQSAWVTLVFSPPWWVRSLRHILTRM